MSAARRPAAFADLLQVHRNRAGMTQQQLADFATLSVRAVRDLERGRSQRPRRETVRLLADVLRLTGPARAAFELAASQCPGGPATGAAAGSAPVAPPAPLAAMVGREAEARLLTDLLTLQGRRLVSVVGLSGVGKTRLVLDVAGTLHAQGGWSVLWVPAAVDAEPAPGVATHLADMLSRPYGADDEIADLVGDRDTLLVVDGCAGRRPADARLLRLLQRCPGLRIVTTGLAPRHLIGEQVVPLGGLPVPATASDVDATALAAFAAVEVLVAQIRRYRPDFRLTAATAAGVADLCRRLDGVPRALELVADWCLVHPPEQLLADPPVPEIASSTGDGGPNLCESVRRTLVLLDPALRALLAHLERLPAAFSVAEAAASLGRSAFDLGRALHTLLVHGLLRVSDAEPDRFQVVNLVRLARAEGRGGWANLEAIA